jgi:hypothetical protein
MTVIRLQIIALIVVTLVGLPPVNSFAKIDLVTLEDRNSIQTTIYNQADLTLVRDSRTISLKKGMNQLQFSWSNTKIDPTSLMLEFKQHSEKIAVLEMIFPSRTREVGIWRIQTDEALQVPMEITYFTSGITWQSHYMALLTPDRTAMHLKGYVKVTNQSGEDYDNAQTRLVVGTVHLLDEIARMASLQHPYGRPVNRLGRSEKNDTLAKGVQMLDAAMPAMMTASQEVARSPKQIEKKGLSEFFLYTIDGTETIPNQWSKRLLSFEANDIKVKNSYKYDRQQYGTSTIQFLTFENSEENNLGSTPLPGGNVKVFRTMGKQGQMEYIGEDQTKYIPVDKRVELRLGASREVIIKPTIKGYQKKNIIYDKKGNLSGFDEVKEVEVRFSNSTPAACTLEYTRNFDSPAFKIAHVTAGEIYETVDQDTIKFTLSLGPFKQKTISFQQTIKRGERQWQ